MLGWFSCWASNALYAAACVNGMHCHKWAYRHPPADGRRLSAIWRLVTRPIDGASGREGAGQSVNLGNLHTPTGQSVQIGNLYDRESSHDWYSFRSQMYIMANNVMKSLRKGPERWIDSNAILCITPFALLNLDSLIFLDLSAFHGWVFQRYTKSKYPILNNLISINSLL